MNDAIRRFLGNAAVSSGDFVHRAIEAADLIINVGHDVIEKPPFIMKQGGVRVIHINFFTVQVDPVYFPQLEVVGDIGNSIWQIWQKLLESEVEQDAHWDFSYFDKVRSAACSHQQQGIDDPRFPIYPQRLVADVRQVMPSDGIIALDNGIYKYPGSLAITLPIAPTRYCSTTHLPRWELVCRSLWLRDPVP